MNRKLRKNYGFLGIAAFCLLLSTGVSAAKGVQAEVVGQDNIAVDRQAIQDAIDSAPGKDLTVKLRGTFQLDCTDIIIARSNLTIKGEKQGATLNGTTGCPSPPTHSVGNRGFSVRSSLGPFMNIEIKKLEFNDLRTAVMLRGTFDEIQNVSINNNRIENSIFGVSLIGQVHDVKIADNDMANLGESGILVYGGPISGVEILKNDINPGIFGAGIDVWGLNGPVSNIKISKNTVASDNIFGVWVGSDVGGQVSDIKIVDNYVADAILNSVFFYNVTGAIIENNFLSTTQDFFNFPAPFYIEGDNTNFLVKGNTMQGGFTGVYLEGDSNNSFIVTQNCIRDGGTQGPEALAFRSGGIRVGGLFGDFGSGFEIIDNSYENNVAGNDFDPEVLEPTDVNLKFESMNNTVMERVGTIVRDEGTSNSVVISGGGRNYCNN